MAGVTIQAERFDSTIELIQLLQQESGQYFKKLELLSSYPCSENELRVRPGKKWDLRNLDPEEHLTSCLLSCMLFGGTFEEANSESGEHRTLFPDDLQRLQLLTKQLNANLEASGLSAIPGELDLMDSQAFIKKAREDTDNGRMTLHRVQVNCKTLLQALAKK